MAFVVKTGQQAYPKIYNVEQAVGPNAPNASGDVKLVQYMLRNIYGTQAAALAVDGWIGPTTNSWIKRFQTDAKAAGNNVLVDGRIDRAIGQTSSVSKTTYAMIVMNTALRRKNPAAFNNLENAVPMSATPKPSAYNPAPNNQAPTKTTLIVTGSIYVVVGVVGTGPGAFFQVAVYDGRTLKFLNYLYVPTGAWSA